MHTCTCTIPKKWSPVSWLFSIGRLDLFPAYKADLVAWLEYQPGTLEITGFESLTLIIDRYMYMYVHNYIVSLGNFQSKILLMLKEEPIQGTKDRVGQPLGIHEMHINLQICVVFVCTWASVKFANRGEECTRKQQS